MKRKECVSNGELTMLFAQESDRRLLYDLSMEDSEIILSMFNNLSDFRWEDIRDEKAEFFNERDSLNKYLFIEYNKEIVGIFYHTYHDAPITNVEFHIWFVSKKHTGKGIGTKAVSMMKNYLHQKFDINTFLMRPWTKNPQAIHTYEKCGFKQIHDFDIHQFFTPDEIEKYGNGAYSEEETANMLAVIYEP